MRDINLGENNPNWKGGGYIDNEGYVYLRIPDHPFCKSNGNILEHRVVMEKHLGRYLKPNEDVHHINGVKNDNRIENLQLLPHGKHSVVSNMIYSSDHRCIKCGRDTTQKNKNGAPLWRHGKCCKCVNAEYRARKKTISQQSYSS